MLKKIITLLENIFVPTMDASKKHEQYVQYWYETIGEIAKRLDYRGIAFTINKHKELHVYTKDSNEFAVSIKLGHNVKSFVVIVHWGCRTNNVKLYPQTNTKIVETLVTAITAIYGE